MINKNAINYRRCKCKERMALLLYFQRWEHSLLSHGPVRASNGVNSTTKNVHTCFLSIGRNVVTCLLWDYGDVIRNLLIWMKVVYMLYNQRQKVHLMNSYKLISYLKEHRPFLVHGDLGCDTVWTCGPEDWGICSFQTLVPTNKSSRHHNWAECHGNPYLTVHLHHIHRLVNAVKGNNRRLFWVSQETNEYTRWEKCRVIKVGGTCKLS